jgi:nucleotide-binding universal stress UspA family protein
VVALDLHRPVLTRARPRASAGYRRVLVPVVHGPEGELAVDLACRFASDRHAVVVALAPIEIPLDMPLNVPAKEAEADAHALLERAIAIGASYGVKMVPRIVRTRNAGDAILEEAARGAAEIVVVGLPRLTNGARLGRTIDFVLKHAACRVMLASAPPG